jgi:hypothetical protein
VELAVLNAADSQWHSTGPIGAAAIQIRAVLARVLWCAIHPDCGVAGLPEGWFDGRLPKIAAISLQADCLFELENCGQLENLFAGQPQGFCEWVARRTAFWTQCFDINARDADLEALTTFLGS